MCVKDQLYIQTAGRYNNLESLGFAHFTVNDNKDFFDHFLESIHNLMYTHECL